MADSQSQVSISLNVQDNASQVLSKAGQNLNAFGETAEQTAQRLEAVAAQATAAQEALAAASGSGEALSAPTPFNPQAAEAYNQQAQAEMTAAAAANTEAQAEESVAAATTKSSDAHGISITRLAQLTLEYEAVSAGIRAVTSGVTGAVSAAENYQQALQGAVTVGMEFGQSASQINSAVQSLSQGGLLSATTSAKALQQVMQRGLNADQATQLVQAFQNIAAYGKQAGTTVTQAVESMASGFRDGRSAALENQGAMQTLAQMQQQYADKLGVSVQALTPAQQAQAEYNGLVAQGAVEAGNAAQYAQTAAGAQEVFANQTQNAGIALGQELLPALQLVEQGLANALVPASQSSQQSLVGLQQAFLSLALPVTEAADLVVGFAKTAGAVIGGLATGDFRGVGQAWQDTTDSMNQTWQNYLNDMTKAAQGGFQAVTADGVNAATQLRNQLSSLSRQERQQIADLTQSFNEANAQRLDSFQESLTQMVIAHEQKVTDIKAQLADETDAFDQANATRLQSYNDQVDSANQSYQDKVSSIQQQIQDEKDRGYVVDGELFTGANQKKIDQLNQELTKEQTAYQDQLAKLKTTYDQQTQTAQDAYSKKYAALQQELAQEQAILQQHAAEVAQVNSQTAEDDISKLERKYAQETALADQHYQDQLAKIQQNATAAGDSAVANFAQGLQNGTPHALSLIHSSSFQMGQTFAQSLHDGALQAAGQARGGGGPGTLLKSITDAVGSVANFTGDLGVNFMNGLTHALFGFADGGVITHPTMLIDMQTGLPYGQMAEAGPEAIVPLGGNRSGGTSGTSAQQFIFNNYGPVQSELDMAALMRQFAFGARG